MMETSIIFIKKSPMLIIINLMNNKTNIMMNFFSEKTSFSLMEEIEVFIVVLLCFPSSELIFNDDIDDFLPLL